MITSLRISVQIPFGDSWSWTLKDFDLVYSIGLPVGTRRHAPVSPEGLVKLAGHLEECGFWDSPPLCSYDSPAFLFSPPQHLDGPVPPPQLDGMEALDAPKWLFHAATAERRATVSFTNLCLFMRLVRDTSLILDVRFPGAI